jgi:hypothetical protein
MVSAFRYFDDQIKEDEVGGSFSTCVRDEIYIQNICLRTPWETYETWT